MGAVPIELTTEECLRYLQENVVGRIAFATPGGLRIVPVNYTVVEDRIVVRTSAYSELGTYGAGGPVAFEIDQINQIDHCGWSVVAHGRAEWITDIDRILRHIRSAWDPQPWAGGSRELYLEIPWKELGGRRLEPEQFAAGTGTSAAGPTVAWPTVGTNTVV